MVISLNPITFQLKFNLYIKPTFTFCPTLITLLKYLLTWLKVLISELDETNEESLPTGENEELKEFVKSFLMQKLDKMKTEIISDITTGKQSPVKSPKNKRTPEAKSPVKKK